MKLPLLAAVGCLLLSTPVFAMTDTECSAMWKQADVNADGSLSAVEAERYSAWMRTANKPVTENGMLDEATFTENCKADVFTTAAVDEGAPLKGANSFTEEQAKDRAIAAGYADVSALAKDGDGIWRGTANKDGKSVKIAVDFKGNVVAS